jgi:hypothetical protein
MDDIAARQQMERANPGGEEDVGANHDKEALEGQEPPTTREERARDEVVDVISRPRDGKMISVRKHILEKCISLCIYR